MFDTFLHKFYSAQISIGLDGTMLVASSKERMLIWGMIFCFIAAASLVTFIICRPGLSRQLSLLVLLFSFYIPLFIIPAANREYIHITREHMTIDSGKRIGSSLTVVSFRELNEISRNKNEHIITNLIGDNYVEWEFNRRNGSLQTLVLNDFFTAHILTIAHYIRDRWFRVIWLE